MRKVEREDHVDREDNGEAKSEETQEDYHANNSNETTEISGRVMQSKNDPRSR